MKKHLRFVLNISAGFIMVFAINTFTERAAAEYTDPDAFTFTDPASSSCTSCSEVSLNITIPTTTETPTEPPVTPPTTTGGGSSSGSSSGGSGSVATPKIVTPSPVVEQKNLPEQKSTSSPEATENISEEKKPDSPSYSSLFGLTKELAESISSDESKNITDHQARVQFTGNNASLYKKIILTESAFSEKIKITVAYFIESGTLTTRSLGSGERAGVINSYATAFGRIPGSDPDWQDVIKIANGRWPAEKNSTAESKAAAKFKKIYLREANMKNANDNAAVTIMAYGLRPVKRNMNSEKSAILSFKYIYKKAPTTAEEWDIVRSIAYSGAKR